MEDNVQLALDRVQVEKAADYMLSYHKAKMRANPTVLLKPEPVSVRVLLWKLSKPALELTFPLPRQIRSDKYYSCMITRDEPNKNIGETETFYMRLLKKHEIKIQIEIIPLNKLKRHKVPKPVKESGYFLCLVDSRVRDKLSPFFGNRFYKMSVCRQPLWIDLESEDLAAEVKSHVQRTRVTTSGNAYDILVGDTDMKVEDLVENIFAVAEAMSENLPLKGKNVRSLLLKTPSSLFLPIYKNCSPNLEELDLAKEDVMKLNKLEGKMQKAVRQKLPGYKDTGVEVEDEEDAANQNGADDAAGVMPKERHKFRRLKRKRQESKEKEEGKESEENEEASATKKPKRKRSRKKRKVVNEEENNPTPTVQNTELPLEEKSEEQEAKDQEPEEQEAKDQEPEEQESKDQEPEEQEAPPTSSIPEKTPKRITRKSTIKLRSQK